MALQFSVGARNGMLDAIETEAGASPILKIRSGAAPASCAAADAGTVLATLNLPADAHAAASGGAKSFSGTWQDTAADAAGTAAHFRYYKSDGTTCVMQGTVGTSGTDLIVDNVSFAVGQPFNITGFTLTAPGA